MLTRLYVRYATHGLTHGGCTAVGVPRVVRESTAVGVPRGDSIRRCTAVGVPRVDSVRTVYGSRCTTGGQCTAVGVPRVGTVAGVQGVHRQHLRPWRRGCSTACGLVMRLREPVRAVEHQPEPGRRMYQGSLTLNRSSGGLRLAYGGEHGLAQAHHTCSCHRKAPPPRRPTLPYTPWCTAAAQPFCTLRYTKSKTGVAVLYLTVPLV